MRVFLRMAHAEIYFEARCNTLDRSDTSESCEFHDNEVHFGGMSGSLKMNLRLDDLARGLILRLLIILRLNPVRVVSRSRRDQTSKNDIFL